MALNKHTVVRFLARQTTGTDRVFLPFLSGCVAVAPGPAAGALVVPPVTPLFCVGRLTLAVVVDAA